MDPETARVQSGRLVLLKNSLFSCKQLKLSYKDSLHLFACLYEGQTRRDLFFSR
jgi:hypothetical protein